MTDGEGMRRDSAGTGRFSYSRVLVFSIILLIALAGTAATIYEYQTIKKNYEKNAASQQRQTEDNLVQSIRLIDAGFRLFDDSLNERMKDGFSLVSDEYERAGKDPSRMDLQQIRRRLGDGYEVYIINESGIIEYTTYPADLGLDFRNTPYFFEYLTRVRNSDAFFSDRVVNELTTGMLRKYAYMPSPDHRYVFELGLAEPLINEQRSLAPYQEDLSRIAGSNPFVVDMTLYDIEKHAVTDFSRIADPSTQRDLDTVIAQREGITIEEPGSGIRIVYLFVDLKDDYSGSDVSRIIRLTYDTARINRELNNHIASRVIGIIAATVAAAILAFFLSRLLTRPITRIVSDVDAIARGDLGHTVSPTRWREFRAIEDSVNTLVGTVAKSIAKEKEAEQRYRNLVEATSDIVWEVNQDLVFTYVSPNASVILGYPTEEILGMTPFWFMPNDDEVTSLLARYRQLPDEKPPFNLLENTFRTKDGREVILQTSGVPVVGPDGAFAGFRGITRDITRRKQAEEALRAANEQLTASEEKLRQLYSELESRIATRTAELKAAEESARLANMKLNLLSSITRHDILNSLTIVLGYTAFARRASDPQKREQCMEKVEEAATKIEQQIAFTKEYQDLGVVAPQWQEVSDLIGKASRLGSKGSVRIIDETGGLCVFADPLLEKVFSNLIDNALMHAGNQLQTIRFGWHRKNGDLVITCEDDGKGIPPQHKEKIFERGFGANTGLGLFLSREILAITGMTITETGVPGNGARFEIRVPPEAYRFRTSDGGSTSADQ